MAISYSYYNGAVSHFALKKADGICGCRPELTLIGVFCRSCEHFSGTTDGLVICTHPDNRDDEGTSEARDAFSRKLKHRALCALDY